ncbi:MAG: metalloregulator ArsR/SmtB family transcription factor [Nevskia sp.]|nr:metalloregulator ArsR/SmtB family transcription factor [Nevskia sp.]
MKLSISQSTDICRLLADPSRLRLLLLLEAQPLAVAELTEITGLAQSRVSTHLGRLKRAGLVRDQRTNGASLYTLATGDSSAAELWTLMRGQLDDGQARLDVERAAEVVRKRKAGQTWAESVAGRMELHYSPGRTWEATAHALIGLLNLGDTLDVASGDGVLAELIAGQARSVTCLDISAKVLAAARKRLRQAGNVSFCRGDMNAPPFRPGSFDQVFAMHALVYAHEPKAVIAAAAPLLRKGGRLVVATLNAHRHEAAKQAYDHVNLGVGVDALQRWLRGCGLAVEMCRVTSREPRPPYFEVITALARMP